jgi:hypothetical protein
MFEQRVLPEVFPGMQLAEYGATGREDFYLA